VSERKRSPVDRAITVWIRSPSRISSPHRAGFPRQASRVVQDGPQLLELARCRPACRNADRERLERRPQFRRGRRSAWRPCPRRSIHARARLVTSPSCSRRLRALTTGVRLTRNSLARSRSTSLCPGLSWFERIIARRLAYTASPNGLRPICSGLRIPGSPTGTELRIRPNGISIGFESRTGSRILSSTHCL
jgi:hypothetical protein